MTTNFWLNRSQRHFVGFVMSWLICLAFSSVPYKTLSMVKVKVITSLYLEIFCFLGQALGTVMSQICLGKQCTLRSEEQSRIRAYTVCHSVSIIWMHYSTVKPHCSNFRVITANFVVSKFLGCLHYVNTSFSLSSFSVIGHHRWCCNNTFPPFPVLGCPSFSDFKYLFQFDFWPFNNLSQIIQIGGAKAEDV